MNSNHGRSQGQRLKQGQWTSLYFSYSFSLTYNIQFTLIVFHRQTNFPIEKKTTSGLHISSYINLLLMFLEKHRVHILGGARK